MFACRSGPIPHHLAKLTRLETLNLSSNRLSGSCGCSTLHCIATLNQSQFCLAFCFREGGGFQNVLLDGLTGPIPYQLAALTGLKTLGISRNRLTGSFNCSQFFIAPCHHHRSHFCVSSVISVRGTNFNGYVLLLFARTYSQSTRWAVRFDQVMALQQPTDWLVERVWVWAA